ncbi:MAG TPA: transposase [Desulfuromonas sp.]|nr:transposase [Desulfuromonas sp.]HBT82833.1 transposase [Desulfuromonas sp.]
MARKPRIHAPGAIYHVILRGNDRQDIFSDDKDRYRFYEILQKSCERFRHRIHAFCLMTNHLHLEIQVGDIPLSRIMQNVSLRYTQWFNWRHKKSGHVFQGRYKAVMVDADAYLLELAAYIHLNPVRARIADRPEDHRWSSHRAYLGKESLSWLESGFILSQFSTNAGKARAKFAGYVGERMGEGRREEFHGEKTSDSRIFGDDNFVDVVLAETESLPERKPDVNAVVAAVKRLYGIPDERLRAQGRERVASEARGLAAWATLELSGGKLTELARYVGRDPSTLTCAVRQIEKRRETDPLLVDKMERLRLDLLESSYQVLTL